MRPSECRSLDDGIQSPMNQFCTCRHSRMLVKPSCFNMPCLYYDSRPASIGLVLSSTVVFTSNVQCDYSASIEFVFVTFTVLTSIVSSFELKDKVGRMSLNKQGQYPAVWILSGYCATDSQPHAALDSHFWWNHMRWTTTNSLNCLKTNTMKQTRQGDHIWSEQ